MFTPYSEDVSGPDTEHPDGKPFAVNATGRSASDSFSPGSQPTTFERALEVLAFCIVLGAAYSFWDYRFGTGNHVEQLPIVYRAMDSSYLVNDFFVNANVQYGPRFVFAHLLAALTAIGPLPFVVACLTFVSTSLVALITYTAARDLYSLSHATALLAVCSVVAVDGVDFGGATGIRSSQLAPQTLVMPLVLVSVWAGLRGSLVVCAILSGIASLVHPLLGLEVGCATLWAAMLSSINGPWARGPRHVSFRGGVVPFLIILLFTTVSVLPYSLGEQIGTGEFLSIVVSLRHPHHYLASTFPLAMHLRLLGFLLALAVSLSFFWGASLDRQPEIRATVMLAATIVFACVCGFLFVDIWPSRVWATAQPFRMLVVLKWLAFILMAGFAEERVRRAGGKALGLSVYASCLSPLVMGVYSLLAETLSRLGFRRRLGMWALPLAVPGVLLMLRDTTIAGKNAILLASFVSLATIIIARRRTLFWTTAAIVIGSMLVAGGFKDALHLPPVLAAQMPQFTLKDLSGDDVELADFAKRNTPEDGVFLTPPDLGSWRLTANRAIVVDFKSFPFQGLAIRQWFSRLTDCYGHPQETGGQAESELVREYHVIRDSKIAEISEKYGISYAVLFSDTQTDLPVIHQNNTYKLVAVGP